MTQVRIKGPFTTGTDISSATELGRTYPGAGKLMIQAFDANIRIGFDSTPTTTEGYQLKPSEGFKIIDVGTKTVVKVIEEAATCDLQWQWSG